VCSPMIVGQQRSGLTLLSSTGAVEGAAADRGLPNHPTTGCHKLSASEAPDPGRHHVGILGDIISECPGDFIGIRRVVGRLVAARRCRGRWGLRSATMIRQLRLKHLTFGRYCPVMNDPKLGLWSWRVFMATALK
jgi:hypothetical protein